MFLEKLTATKDAGVSAEFDSMTLGEGMQLQAGLRRTEDGKRPRI